MRRAFVLGLIGPLAVGTLALASPRSVGSGPGTSPAVDPSNFVRHVTNPFFPLKPGTLWVYRGIKDGKTQIDRVFVTHKTNTIVGIRATVVRDVATQEGRVIERTFDWYAQDRQGNVWYLGEDTTSFENGNVSKEGSWETGVHGAVPGIVMEAEPQVADGYRQEFWKGHAEDQAWVLARGGPVHVPLGNLHHALKTMEWTPLEPNVIDKKVYSRGTGLVSEESQTGPLETALLIRIHRPNA
ncbi:MAG: hypothetical protein M3Q23_06035 [Actinomycetota bacterium]|nr:hypothetical protein [Actinomycetota bacterium]